jgi:two-component system sensor histidine kinase CpxA
LVVRGDTELLTRALSNLLRNAVRYAGEAGPITVSAQREQDEVKIIVADRGPGVPAHDLPRIFDPFYRADASRDRETGGVGLGLAIVKTCIESCGGAVSCRNLEPAGLEVTIRLQFDLAGVRG